MTTLLMFLAAAGLACLIRLHYEKIKPGTALLVSACSLTLAAAVFCAIDLLIPDIMPVLGWFSAVACWAGLAATILRIYKPQKSTGMLSSGTLIFLALGILFPMLHITETAGGAFTALEALISGMGGTGFSAGCLICAAACAALCDEIRKPVAALPCAVLLVYAFGISGLQTTASTAAGLALFMASALMLAFGEAPDCAAPMITVPAVLILQGTPTTWIALILLVTEAFLRQRKAQRQGEPMVAYSVKIGGLIGVTAVLLRFFTDRGGIFNLPTRVSQSWQGIVESLRRLSGSFSEYGLAELGTQFHALYVLALLLTIPMLLAFFSLQSPRRREILQGMGFGVVTALLCCLGSLIHGDESEFAGTAALAPAVALLLCFEIFLLVRCCDAAKPLWLCISAVCLLTVGMVAAVPPSTRFAHVEMQENVTTIIVITP